MSRVQGACIGFRVRLIVSAAVLSVAYGANTGQTTMCILAMLYVITKSQAVPATADVGIVLHAMKTVATLFGTINWGGRLASVTELLVPGQPGIVLDFSNKCRRKV
ncbi:TPA: hypothetical protein ACH3X1_006100 [Trebouxia sp. C0004]